MSAEGLVINSLGKNMKSKLVKSGLWTLGLLATAISISAQAAPLLSEGFDDITTLPAGWIFSNASTPTPGTNWFQGNAGVFSAQSGAVDSYIASDYLAEASPFGGGGFIDNRLFTPFISLESSVTLTFWARADILDGFSDTFAVLAGTVSGGPEVISEVLGTTVALGNWTQYTVNLAGQGAGALARFGFEYFGPADSSNYIGFDTVGIDAVAAAVPEPGTFSLLALGAAALALRRRKSAA